MITTITDGLAILAIRHNFYFVLFNVARLVGLIGGFIVLPLALVVWGVWAVFLAPSDDVAVEATQAPAVEAVVAPEQTTAQAETPVAEPSTAEPVSRPVFVPSTANAELLESNPPQSRSEHLSAARSAVSARQARIAAYNIKMVMQYDLQEGRELSKDVRNLMRDAVMIGMDSNDIGNFVTSASEKYKSQWPQAEQQTYEAMRSIFERARN